MSISFDKLGFIIKAAETKIFGLSGVTLVLFFVFAIILLGYLVGKINVKGVTLGSAAIFIVALVAGHFKGVTIGYEGHEGAIAGWAEKLSSVDAYFKLIQNLGLVFFVTAVGLIAGPKFFRTFNKSSIAYLVMGIIVIGIGGLTAIICTVLDENLSAEMAAGLLTGGLTSTPGFSAAKEAVEGAAQDEISAGYGIAYLYGVLGVVLFVQVMPKILKVDIHPNDEELFKEILLGKKAIDFNLIDKINKKAGDAFNYRYWGTYGSTKEALYAWSSKDKVHTVYTKKEEITEKTRLYESNYSPYFGEEFKVEKVKDEFKIIFNDEELNTMEYKDAVKFDKRNYLQYYWSLLKISGK